MPFVLAPPSTSVFVPARHEPDDDMEVLAEAGIISDGTSAPVTQPKEPLAQQFLQAVLQMFLSIEHIYTKETMRTKVVTAGHLSNKTFALL